jgi:predicted HTH domain antitoxin|nr:hypothetical protein [Proteiniphilum sp. UBA4988]
MTKKISKELKILFLSILKSGTISETDVNSIAKLSGIEPQLLQIEVIDRTEQVERLTDQELDDRIVELEKKMKR